MPRRIDLGLARRIGRCLEENAGIRKTRLCSECRANNASCTRYLRWMESMGLVVAGRRIRLTERGRAALCGRRMGDPPIELAPPPDVTVEASGPLTSVDIGEAVVAGGGPAPAVTNNAPAAFPVGVTVVAWIAMGPSRSAAVALQMVTVTGAGGAAPKGAPHAVNFELQHRRRGGDQ